MKKWLKILIWLITTPVALLLALFFSYIIVNQQGVIQPFHVGNANAKYKILIASQGSSFKEVLVERYVNELKNDSTFISILDCTELDESYVDNFDAFIVIHTMQIHKIPEEADIFLHKLPDLSRVVLVSTSGAGDEHYEKLDIDGISSASRLSAIDPILEWTLPKIKDILKI
jgi:hypothetical protein